jgi:hypothetical protein
MAGERKGKAYEALVYLALAELIEEGVLAGPLHWNVRPGGMNIEPDFTLGSDVDHPETIILLGHSGSTGNSHMKLWRNVGELVEAKTLLPDRPHVHCLMFGVIKNELEHLQAAAFDGFRYVRLSDEPAALHVDIGLLLKTKKIKESVVAGKFSPSKETFEFLKRLLTDLCTRGNSEMESLWRLHAARPAPPLRSPSPSSFKKGLAKLLVVPSWEMAVALFVKRKPVDAPAVLARLNITRMFGGKHVAKDGDVARLCQAVPLAQLRNLYERDWGTSVGRMVNVLREPQHVSAVKDYFARNEATLTDPARLHKLLSRGYRSEGQKLGRRDDDGNWIFDFYLSLAKAIRGTKNAYGYAQLAKDIVENDGYGVALTDESKNLLLSPWGNLSEWSTGQLVLDDEIVRALAAALASCGRNARSWLTAVNTAEDVYLTTYLEAKLAAHRSLDPVGLIVCGAVGGAKSRIVTCFAERAGTTRSGKTECLRIRSTIVKWQSAHGSHTNDKRKELCGRAIGLRYHWDGAKFVPRTRVMKMILVLDGSWEQGDINALLQAGWDDIFFPDEIDRLQSAIV